MSKDYYKILGVEKKASESEIKDAYMKKVKTHHPDLNPGSKEHEDKFKEVNEAYETLKDSSKRKQYDSYGSDYDQQNYGQGQQQYRQYSSGQEGFDFESIFKNFGFGFDEDMFQGNSRGQQRQTRAADLQYTLKISLEDSFTGTSKKIDIPTQENCSSCKGSGHLGSAKTCSQCNGQGQVKRVVQSPFGSMVTVTICDKCNGKGKTYEKRCDVCRGLGIVKGKKTMDVKIPKGVTQGTVLRLQKEGFEDGKYKGDLYLKIVFENHPKFTLEHYDVYSKETIDLITAILGGEIKVDTLEGQANLKIPQGTQSHTILRMKGQGMYELNSNSRGDQYVRVIIETPKDLTKEQIEALKIIFGKTSKKEQKDFLKKLKDLWK
jgi:molecular chaperone DnaJ